MGKAFPVIAALLIAGLACAQGQSAGPTCTTCITLSDNSCTASPTDCSSNLGRESYQFTVPCTGCYFFACKTACSNPAAGVGCITCASIIEISTGQVVATCQAVLDAQGGCENPCARIPAACNVNLTANTDYKLTVGMNLCRDAQSCAACSGCEAKARIYYAGSDCTAW